MKKKIFMGMGMMMLLACSTKMSLERKSFLSKSKTEKTIAEKPEWKMVFSDDFRSQGYFDSTKWSFCSRQPAAWSRYLTASPKYAYQRNGKLVLRMDNAVIAEDNIPYHSGGIQSSGKFSIRYGKIEVRAKFKKGQGSWPAIWMMPEKPTAYGSWPKSGEIDIMEHVNNEEVVHQTIHNARVTSSNGTSTSTHRAKYNANSYNTYGIIWNASAIDFYINGTFQYRYEKGVGTSPIGWPFDKPFYIILNQSGAVGWPGPAKAEDLPFEMQVDWVNVYSRE
ncbi:glycoside hydrolase family 16 protein [Pedobacter rhizosphaerae]|uniref:Glycosyl hydrolases family 16 n=1 Tax=Pedobacter rhizosphaerae TaxID=390241 RepID=A0A1H9T442_9SPHI|nr:Glycosyl hydrolases family 16 [Pedobacter rhizosphaerae]